ncbi:MAG TPA: FAD:protein FMN transferase [Burkholderiales bacterium]|nr:FAD:protein FMN transferase [Burkholderiales bacterium]
MDVRVAPPQALSRMPRARPEIWLLWLCVALAFRPAAGAEYRAASYVFGTIAKITIVGDDAAAAHDAAGAVLHEFDRLHRELHAWQPGPLVALNAAIARGDRTIRTTPEIAELIVRAQRLEARSDGAFDPAIGRLVALWNFHRDTPGGPLPGASDIERLAGARPRMADLRVAGDIVTSANPLVQLDFGGYAKGYALDRAARILHARGVANALIDVGGNVMALGEAGNRPWRVAIEAPRGAGTLGTLELRDGEAMGTSGDYRRYYEIAGRRYAHIIDPRTGYPVCGVESVTVLVAPGPEAGALSDAASKPIFIAGREGWREAAMHMGVAGALLVDSDGVAHMTAPLRARLRAAGAPEQRGRYAAR